TDASVRTQTECQQLEKMRRLDPGSNIALTSEGQIELNGQVTMHPSRLGEIPDADLTNLMRLTRELQAKGGTEAALKTLSAADQKLLTALRGQYNFRFT